MWVSIAIIIVGAEICALALILVRRYRQQRPNRYHKSPIAGDIFGVIGTGFAVILAFAAAFALYRWIETPLTEAARRLLLRSRRAPTLQPAE